MAKMKKKLKLELKYVIFSIALVFAVINGAIILYNINITNSRNQTIAVSDKPAADKIHAMAVEALIPMRPKPRHYSKQQSDNTNIF